MENLDIFTMKENVSSTCTCSLDNEYVYSECSEYEIKITFLSEFNT